MIFEFYRCMAEPTWLHCPPWLSGLLVEKYTGKEILSGWATIVVVKRDGAKVTGARHGEGAEPFSPARFYGGQLVGEKAAAAVSS